MAITPATYDLRPQRRADFSLLLQFKDADGVGLDLTGWQILAQVWDRDRLEMAAEFTVTPVDLETGRVELKLPYTETETLPLDGRYDVMLIRPDGLREYYLEGKVLPDQGYTAPTQP